MWKGCNFIFTFNNNNKKGHYLIKVNKRFDLILLIKDNTAVHDRPFLSLKNWSETNSNKIRRVSRV